MSSDCDEESVTHLRSKDGGALDLTVHTQNVGGALGDPITLGSFCLLLSLLLPGNFFLKLSSANLFEVFDLNTNEM